MSSIPSVGPLEVGHAINSQAAQTIATYEIINNFLQTANEKINRTESDLKTVISNTGIELSSLKLGFQRLQKKEEENKAGVIKCKAQDEKLRDSLGQLGGRVSELGEGVRFLGQNVEGVGQELQTLRQEI